MPSDWAAPWVPWSQGRKAGVEEGRAAELNGVLLQGVGWARQESWSWSVGGRGSEKGVGLRAGGQAGGGATTENQGQQSRAWQVASRGAIGLWGQGRCHLGSGGWPATMCRGRSSASQAFGPRIHRHAGLSGTWTQSPESHSVVSTCVTSASHPTLSLLLGLGVQRGRVRLPTQPEALLATCRARALGPGCPTMWPDSCCHSKWL